MHGVLREARGLRHLHVRAHVHVQWCAKQQWKGCGGGFCPICREDIRDVIRTYRA